MRQLIGITILLTLTLSGCTATTYHSSNWFPQNYTAPWYGFKSDQVIKRSDGIYIVQNRVKNGPYLTALDEDDVADYHHLDELFKESLDELFSQQ